MNRSQAFDKLLARVLLRAAKQRGSAEQYGIQVGCHPYTGSYNVTKAH